MNPIVGRADDMLIVRGVNVYPSQIEEAFSFVEGVIPNYYLTPLEKQQMIVQLEVDVEVSHQMLKDKNLTKGNREYDDFIEMFSKRDQAEIKKRVGITTHVKINEQDSLPKCTGGKIDRILKKNEMVNLIKYFKICLLKQFFYELDFTQSKISLSKFSLFFMKSC